MGTSPSNVYTLYITETKSMKTTFETFYSINKVSISSDQKLEHLRRNRAITSLRQEGFQKHESATCEIKRPLKHGIFNEDNI